MEGDSDVLAFQKSIYHIKEQDEDDEAHASFSSL